MSQPLIKIIAHAQRVLFLCVADPLTRYDGFLLISITVVTAYFVENMFKTLSTCLSNWRTLLLLLIILYRIAFTTTVTMEILASSEVRTQYSRGVDVEKVAVDLYEHPERMKNLTAEEVVDVNNQIRDFQWTRFASCRNKTKSLDTDYKFGMENIEEFCHARGTGTKEIVLVGNSLAKDFEYSVTSSMKDVYSRFTMFGTHLCMPFLPELFVKQKPKCQGFSDDVVPILRQWQRPIDIVITVHSWNELRIHKFSRNDHYQQVIQNFYSELNKIARELVILNRGDINTPKPFQVIQNAVRRGLNLDRFNYPFSQNEQQNSEVYKRVDNLNCPKCLKANLYQESFCSNATNSCCLVNENGVANFHDGRHMTTFGSLVMGRTLRRLYDGLGKL
uniref:SGNH domain-containing protein n=1 Tax=Bursaphelenchus xylophilus TaxID=6326 RepID=A0A1I7SFN1_BURXY